MKSIDDQKQTNENMEMAITGKDQIARDDIVLDNEQISTPDGDPTPAEVMHKIHDKAEIMKWLKEIVALPQYYKNFVDNGFESMEFVEKVETVYDLAVIGIENKEDQGHILEAIQKLREQPGNKAHDFIQDVEGNATGMQSVENE